MGNCKFVYKKGAGIEICGLAGTVSVVSDEVKKISRTAQTMSPSAAKFRSRTFKDKKRMARGMAYTDNYFARKVGRQVLKECF